MREAYTLEQLKNILLPLLERNHVRKAILFGSYGKGSPTPHSDVDLLVDSGLRGDSWMTSVSPCNARWISSTPTMSSPISGWAGKYAAQE